MITTETEPVYQGITAALQPYVSEGWLTPERGCEIASLVMEHKPSICVEIGVFGARSLVSVALALKQLGHGKIFGIDPWRKEDALEGENEANRKWWSENMNLHDIHKGAMEMIWRLGLDEHTVIIRAASQQVYKLFPMINWLTVDGCHSEVASCRDVDLYVPRVVPGGIIYFDDSDWPSTRKAIALLNAQAELIKDGGGYRIYSKR